MWRVGPNIILEGLQWKFRGLEPYRAGHIYVSITAEARLKFVPSCLDTGFGLGFFLCSIDQHVSNANIIWFVFQIVGILHFHNNVHYHVTHVFWTECGLNLF